MFGAEEATAPRDSRVLVFSQRNLAHDAWMGGQYEFEDLIAQFEDASILSPRAEARSDARTFGYRAANAALRRLRRPRRYPFWYAQSMVPERVASYHDVFFGVFHSPHQLAHLHRLEGWRDRCRTRVCFLVETWTPTLKEERDYLELLREFDVVYVFNQDLIPGLAALRLAEATYLPFGVDALARSPLPLLPERLIDVYSYGRRSERIHHDLLDYAAQHGLTYIYDTLEEGVFRDHREHLLLQANLMKRSRYFVAHTINDSPVRRERTGGDEGLSFRYFEAVAAGAVILGSRPDTPLFDELFPWKDSVVPLPYESDQAAAVLDELDAQPQRVARIRADSVRGSLRAHDWSHRWSRILEDLGLPHLEALDARLEALRAVSDGVTPELFADSHRRRRAAVTAEDAEATAS